MRSFPIPTNTKTTTLAPTTSAIETVTTTKTTSTSSPLASPWHSPVPYLFGGLAIIMALISMALFILACSYWRLTRSTQQRDLENINNNNNKEGDEDPQEKEHPLVYEEKILVIMAGNHKPTFLATPSSTNINFHKNLGNSENFDMSHKEISDNKSDDVSDENGSSRQHNQQPSQ